MASNHYDKWIIKSLLGFLLIVIAVFFIYYSLAYLQDTSRWVIFAVLDSLCFSLGVYFMGSAFVHKLKFDIKHRQKTHEQAGSDR
ncbi:MAG: hypothetical protein GC171_02450 [Terrimonas sp.]|nr:hypothetical protein [Terrimonas sp.]